MWSVVSVFEGRNASFGFTRRAFRVRRKEDSWRRQVWQIHSVDMLEEAMEGRNE